MTKESLGNWFREACSAAGCPGSAHGLRKRAATRLAKAGANFAQLRAYFGGWTTDAMPSLYTQAVERQEAALAAAAKGGASGEVIPLFDDED